MTKPSKKIYLAGPDVFLPEAADIARKKKALCVDYGFDGLFPSDTDLHFDGDRNRDLLIYRSNVALMRQADAGIFNLTPFRSPSADPGTVFELGLMIGLDKPVFGYTNDADTLLERMQRENSASFDAASATWRDVHNLTIEDFGNSDNLMIAMALDEQNHPLIRHSAKPENYFTDLEGFIACLAQARAHFGD